jgi:hypothetical protein
MATADQLLINPAKLAGELAQALRSQEFFVHQDLGEFPAPCRESRDLWLSNGGGSKRCPLVAYWWLTWR